MSTTKRSNSYQLPPLNWELAAAVAQARVNELRLQLEAPIPLPAVADASRQDPLSRGHTQPEARRFALPAPSPSSPEVVVVDGTGAAEAVDTAEDDVLLLLSSGTQPPISSQGQASYAESGIVFSSDTRPRQSPFVVASHADEDMPSGSGSAFTASSQPTDEPASSSSSWNLFRRNDYSYNDHGLGDRVFDQAAQEAESERQVQKLRRELQERSRNEPRLGASMLRLVDRFIAMSRGPIGPSQQLVRALDLCPCYASVALRVHTFKYRPWPVELADLALSLVDAGFFYRGVDDLVTCYSCYGSLRNWQPYSNPWVQHALAFPRCLHVLRVRGRSFPCTEWTVSLSTFLRYSARRASSLTSSHPVLSRYSFCSRIFAVNRVVGPPSIQSTCFVAIDEATPPRLSTRSRCRRVTVAIVIHGRTAAVTALVHDVPRRRRTNLTRRRCLRSRSSSITNHPCLGGVRRIRSLRFSARCTRDCVYPSHRSHRLLRRRQQLT